MQISRDSTTSAKKGLKRSKRSFGHRPRMGCDEGAVDRLHTFQKYWSAVYEAVAIAYERVMIYWRRRRMNIQYAIID